MAFRKYLPIILIFSLALTLRVYKISDYPAGPNLDEVSQGYTAYSILKTGRDEWGERLPLSPRAFGDYRAPLYTYLIIPSIALLGLNELAIRLPAAILGSFAVVVLYFLVKELFSASSSSSVLRKSAGFLALAAAFLLAINPWHLSLSRGAFEASLHVFLFPLGFLLFLKGLKNFKYLSLSGIIFGLNLFSYYAPRLFTPMAVAVLLLFWREEFFKKKRNLLFGMLFSAFVLLSFLALLAGGKTRVSDTSLLKPTDQWQRVAARQYEAAWGGFHPIAQKFFNNKLISVSTDFYKQYLDYFSFSFLFSRGPSEATYGMIPGRGVLYLFELPLIIFALYLVAKNKDKEGFLLLSLLLIAPMSAALAKGERAANRAIPMLPLWPIISAVGFVGLWSCFKSSKKLYFKKAFGLGMVFLSALSLLFFLEDYFYHAPTQNAPNMSYGWRQASDYLSKELPQYERVIVSGQLSEPQIAVAYFLKIDPSLFQRYSPSWLEYEKRGFLFVDQLPEYNLDKFTFRGFRFPEDAKLPKTLFIGKPDDLAGVRAKVAVEKTVYYPGPEKKVALKIVSFSQKEAN